jgi:hypothetical protein
MTTFDEREKGYEAYFAHDQERRFKAEARRDRAVGKWAGELMGLTGQALDDYAATVVKADLREPGDEDVFQKLVADLAGKGVDVLPAQVRAKMDECMAAAVESLKAEG